MSKRGDKESALALLPAAVISHIYLVRGIHVMLDSDLARLYGVETKVLNQAVKRNADRFPEDFMFQLTDAEHALLRSQIVTSNASHGGRRYQPYVFTEQGVAMLSSVLRSQRAIAVNIAIMRAFVELRRWVRSHEELARKLAALERKSDTQYREVMKILEQLVSAPTSTKRIGFRKTSKKKP